MPSHMVSGTASSTALKNWYCENAADKTKQENKNLCSEKLAWNAGYMYWKVKFEGDFVLKWTERELDVRGGSAKHFLFSPHPTLCTLGWAWFVHGFVLTEAVNCLAWPVCNQQFALRYKNWIFSELILIQPAVQESFEWVQDIISLSSFTKLGCFF